VANFENNATVASFGFCCQYWLQSTAVELVAGRAGEARDDVGSLPTRNSRGDQLGDGLDRAGRITFLAARPEDERDLALRRFREARHHLGGRPAHDFLELLRQLPADRDLTRGELFGERPERRGQPLRRLEGNDGI